jgi:hypothetical protein
MRAALAALLALSACVPDNGPLMRPGEDCMACHGGQGTLPPGERQRHAKKWTVAGTVFDPADPAQGFEGAYVHVTDANGWSFSLRTNEAGNFYTREDVAFPLQVCISRGSASRCQASALATGSCNSCHGLSVLGAPQPPLTAPP